MPLPTEFVASATALECYEQCPRRFRYRYLEHVPAAGPPQGVARRMERGEIFHRLVLWDELGLDVSMILDTVDDPELVEQWTTYRQFRATLTGVELQHDRTLVARCGDNLVQAKLDALAVALDGSVTIYDWKTSPRPHRSRLAESPQSKVYPFVVWNTLSGITSPAQLDLVYWFAAEPDRPLRIDLDEASLAAATDWLSTLLATIGSDDTFEMTTDRVTCSTCEYLAHCGVVPADGDPWELDEDYYESIDGEDSTLDAAGWLDA